MPVEATPLDCGANDDTNIANSGVNQEESVRSKILSHFIKGKISLTPMETVMIIPGELEQLESLVKVARKKKDAEARVTQLSTVSAIPTLRRLSVGKQHRSKTLHLAVEVNHCLIEGLVDTGASMSVMAASVVRELGLMHLVSGTETYKTASGAVTQALGRVEEVPVKVGGVQCGMTFMVVDTDSYDILIGLDLLMKIGAIVDIEQGRIQVRKGPGADVEVLPLTMVNLVQRSNSSLKAQDNHVVLQQELRKPELEAGWSSVHQENLTSEEVVPTTDSDTDSSHGSDEDAQMAGLVEEWMEFVDADVERLIDREGSKQILQLTMQDRTDSLLREEISDSDDYADWIRWAAEAEQQMQSLSEAANVVEGSELLQMHCMEVVDSMRDVKEEIIRNPKEETRWSEICKKIRIDPKLEKGMERELWAVLEQYQDVFALNKGELGSLGEAMDDEELHREIQDDQCAQGMFQADERILAVWYGQRVPVRGDRRLIKERPELRKGEHGRSPWQDSDPHHLFMLDLTTDGSEAETSDKGQIRDDEDEGQEPSQGQQVFRKDQIGMWGGDEGYRHLAGRYLFDTPERRGTV
ncbi:unnamed protein product [Sphagnum troendelagicum]|uniref:Aspartic peptidase DDI1-type domain-containing protein n=1 Tax=Sphagnum troendelagicum TaxID=128251 RepID=A0ABP0TD12_9BRYO